MLVAGDLMLDRYWTGRAARISPEAPVPVVQVIGREDRLGGAANVAANCAALGAPTTLVGWSGQDEAAQSLRSLLQEAGIHTRIKSALSIQTITKLRVLSQQQQLIRLDFEDTSASASKVIDIKQIQVPIKSCDVFVLSDYDKGSLRDCQPLIQLALHHRRPVLVDPKGLDFDRYRGATLLKPNLSEFYSIVGACSDEAELVQKGRRLIQQLEVGSLLITRGSQGMTWISRTNMTHVAARPQEVYDVTGAGDTVIATLATCLAAGHSMLDSIHLSNEAASIAVKKMGTSTVSAHELGQQFFSQQVTRLSTHEKILAGLQDMSNRFSVWRNAGEKIVMTNGVFDLLHSGHIEYLEHARSLGDRLVVAVNSDASTRRLKGSSRPIVPLDSRMHMLAALSCVDAVIAFNGNTPRSLYANLLPDVLVKGGDYQAHQIAGGKEVERAGGKVVIVPFLEGHSSSGLISKILDRSHV